MDSKKPRNNNSNNNESNRDGYGKLQRGKEYTKKTMKPQTRPLSASSVQREGDNTLVERRSTIDDIKRKEVTGSMGMEGGGGGGGNTRPRPLSTSSLVS